MMPQPRPPSPARRTPQLQLPETRGRRLHIRLRMTTTRRLHRWLARRGAAVRAARVGLPGCHGAAAAPLPAAAAVATGRVWPRRRRAASGSCIAACSLTAWCAAVCAPQHARMLPACGMPAMHQQALCTMDHSSRGPCADGRRWRGAWRALLWGGACGAPGRHARLGSRPLPESCVMLSQGQWSPIVKQVRQGRKPEGICMVCGSCAAGFPPEQNRQGLLAGC